MAEIKSEMKYLSIYILFLVSFLLISFGQSIGAQELKDNSSKSEKMTHANPAPQIEFDDVVGIIYFEENEQKICTGIAVSGDTILTAGHCTCGRQNSYKVIGGADVFLGRRALYNVQSVKHFPGYDCSSSSKPQAGLDIGLIKLTASSTELEDKSRIRSIALMSDTYKKNIRQLHVFGYGRTETGVIGQRRRAKIDVASISCVERRWQDLGCIPFLEFVLSNYTTPSRAGVSQNIDSCGGDSGGPVFWINEENEIYLVGLVSRAIQSNVRLAGLPCGGGGIYSAIGRHSVIRWLKENNVEICLLGEDC